MKILFVTSGTRRVAASRYRVHQYLPYLRSHGVSCRVFSNISDISTGLSIRSPEFGNIARFAYYALLFIERFLRFWAVFFMAPGSDIIFFQRATFPLGLGRLLKVWNRKTVFDIDDAIFLPDTPKRDRMSRFKAFVKENELKEMLILSDCVIVENDYIGKYVSRYCSEVHKIPGPIDTDRYSVKEKDPENKEVVLGWIGSPATTGYLHILDGVFAETLKKFENVKIVLVGAGNYGFPDPRVIRRPWNYDTEISELQDFDIGLMPMPDDEWTRGKLGCKMLQYMAVGIPAVVSYTPTNAEVIEDGVNGFLARTEHEWNDILDKLIRDRGLRVKSGASGRRSVTETCSVFQNAPKLYRILKDLV